MRGSPPPAPYRFQIFASKALMSRPAPFGGGGAWSPRDGGIIVFDASHYGPRLRVAAAGGVAVPVTKVDTAHEERSHGYQSFLSDGRRFVSLARTNTPRNGFSSEAISVLWERASRLSQALHRGPHRLQPFGGCHPAR
jgi:hypothetical protein